MSGRYFIDHGMWHDRKTGRHLEDIVNEVKPSERLVKLLEAVADHEQTPEEAQAELEADGVDVNAFLARVHDDERSWLLARAERAERECGDAKNAFRSAWTRAEAAEHERDAWRAENKMLAERVTRLQEAFDMQQTANTKIAEEAMIANVRNGRLEMALRDAIEQLRSIANRHLASVAVEHLLAVADGR